MTESTIEVRGRARTAVEPDLLVLVFNLETGGDTLADARAHTADRRRTLVDAVTEITPAVAVDVTHTEVSETSQMFDTEVDADYAAYSTVEVRCRPTQFDAVVQAGCGAGAALNCVTPILAQEHRESVRTDLLETATDRAQVRAERTANAVDHEITSLVELSTTDPDLFETFDDEFTADVPVNDIVGLVEVAVRVDAVYELTSREEDH